MNLQLGNMINLNIEFQNYQQVCTILKREEEDGDLSL